MYFRLNFEYNLEFFSEWCYSDVGDISKMLVAESLCNIIYVGDFFHCIESVTNIDRLQHPSPTSL